MHNYKEAGLLLSSCSLLQRYLPRGKGAVPRFLGAHLSRESARYMTTRHGAKLVMASAAYDIYASIRLAGNAWDYEDFEYCVDGMADGQVFYDIGANVGYFSIEMAGLYDCRVIAFEPQTELVEAIRLSAVLNRFEGVQVLDALVGDDDGPAILYLSRSSILASAVPDSGHPTKGRRSKTMVSIDALVAQGVIPRPDFVKIDVEAGEHLVLRGASSTLRSSRPDIYLEYLSEQDNDGHIRGEIESLLRDANYRLYGAYRTNMASGSGRRLFELGDQAWPQVHGIYLRNPDRANPMSGTCPSRCARQ